MKKMIYIICGAALLTGCATSSMTAYYPNGQVRIKAESKTFIGTLNGLFNAVGIVFCESPYTQYCAPCGKIVHKCY